MGINQSLNDSIYGGGGLSSDVGIKGPVAIAGHVYQIDPKQYSRKTLEILRTGSDVQTEPGEQSFNTHGLWKRNIKDWRRGAGQSHFDDNDSIETRDRFYSSKGIDPWTPRQISLQPDPALALSSLATNLRIFPCGGYVALVDGPNIMYTPRNDSLSSFTTAFTGVSILDITTDDVKVYAAVNGAAIQVGTINVAGATANFGTFVATTIGYGNGRLLAAAANRIVEIGAAGAFGGAGQLDTLHKNAGFVWKGFVATPAGIYAWGDAGGISEVYVITVDPATGALKAPVLAWVPPIGETITAMLWDSVIMVIGTSAGFHLATQNTSLSLMSGSLIPITNGVTALGALGRYVWFSWTNFDATSSGLGRMDLAQMVDATNLVPAYASDLMATAQGVVTGVGSSVDGPVYKNRRIFAVNGVGFFRPFVSVVTQGYIDSGWILYSTVERKIAVSVDLRFKPLTGSVAVSLVIDQEDAAPISLSTANVPGSVTPESPFTSNSIPFERAKVLLYLNRRDSGDGVGPIVQRATFRAIPAPLRTDRIVVPCRVFERVESPPINGAEPLVQNLDPLEEFLYLKGLEASGAVVRYQEGISSYNVIIDGIELQPEKFTEDGAYFQSIMGVALMTIDPIA